MEEKIFQTKRTEYTKSWKQEKASATWDISKSIVSGHRDSAGWIYKMHMYRNTDRADVRQYRNNWISLFCIGKIAQAAAVGVKEATWDTRIRQSCNLLGTRWYKNEDHSNGSGRGRTCWESLQKLKTTHLLWEFGEESEIKHHDQKFSKKKNGREEVHLPSTRWRSFGGKKEVSWACLKMK